MGSVKVTVYGRAKPCPKSSQSKEYRIKTGDGEDLITFTTTKPVTTKKSYRFRKIFNEYATQEEVFDVVAKPVIENVLLGYNGTIFTYGQTGSGKTYTMTGDIEQWVYPGLIPRTIQRIFQLKDKDVTVSVTYCEIYNEHVYDLIRADQTDSDFTYVSPENVWLPGKRSYFPGSSWIKVQVQFSIYGCLRFRHVYRHVSILEDSSGVTHFRNLSVHIVNTAYEAIQLLIRGDANKMVAETASNAKSSRSHVLFSITLEVPHPNQEKLFLKPVLYLVDLAGSEKLSKCKTQMANPWETRYINLSLHYLEQVLLALRQPNRVHIPYRNSLMTALLRNSLGGNCITAMIATFCLSVDDTEETIQTCRFAERIAFIKNEVKITDVFTPEREIEELKKENKKLKSQIKLLGGQLPNEELNDEEKEKCAALVRNFIENSVFESLPYTDVKKMEYCLCLLRDEIVTRPARENNSQNVLEFFKNCPRVSVNHSVNASKSVPVDFVKPERNWKRMKNTIVLPKVNITYDNSKTDDDLKADKSDPTCKMISLKESQESDSTSKMISSKESHESGKILIESEGVKCDPWTSEERKKVVKNPHEIPHKVNENSCFLPRHFSDEHDNLKHKGEDDDVKGVRFSEEEIKTIRKYNSSESSADWQEVSPTESTFKIEVVENEILGPGITCAFGTLKKLVNVGVQAESEIESDNGETLNVDCEGSDEDDDDDDQDDDQEEDEDEDEGNMSSASKGSSKFSASHLPLTGDIDIDEEIIKFYKARYNLFNRPEKQNKN